VLGIPGEELAGSVSAAALAGWYNGHPDHRSLDPPLDAPRAIVVGHGNVALDAARMLVLGEAALRATDVAPHALERLAAGRVREVVLAGRRGPAQAAFTASELLALDELDDVEVVVHAAELAQALRVEDRDAMADLRVRRNLKALRKLAERSTGRRASRRIVIRFLLAPQRLVGCDRVTAVWFAHNELAAGRDGRPHARATSRRERLSAGLVVRAIGYRGVRLGDLPFDERTGIVPNDRGRVLGRDGPLPGQYVVGWIKRGPSGVVAANEDDAAETVGALLDDIAERRAAQRSAATS
jgi:ferredoxin--NADP+ reductase